MSRKKQQDTTIYGWYAETRNGDFEAGLDHTEMHSGTRCAYLKSLVPKLKRDPANFGNLTQAFEADDYHGTRLRMSAWVKTELTDGSAQLWLRIDGDWECGARRGCFDNMDDRRIMGLTAWQEYSLVVDVPPTSTYVVFGFMLPGIGQAWLDDVSFETVSKEVPLTGIIAGKTKPINLNFEDDDR